MKVMDIYDWDKRSKGAKFRPMAEPKGRRSGSCSPQITVNKEIFSLNNGWPRWGAAASDGSLD
jgi:hypothetical protein